MDDQIPVEDLALLECLLNLDDNIPFNRSNPAFVERLFRIGLATRGEDGVVRMTFAGIERCRSLQHRVSSDMEAMLEVQADIPLWPQPRRRPGEQAGKTRTA